jgi:hypothetical protein
MKIVKTGSKIFLLVTLLSLLAFYLGSCKKTDTIRTPADTLRTPANINSNKLVGSGAIGNALQGYSVAISADGNTLV